MDWFWNIVDTIIQNRIWNMFFGHFHLVDWIAVVFGLIGLFYGLKNGFFRCVVVTLEGLGVLWFVMTFYKKVGAILLQNLSFIGEGNARPVGYIALLTLSGVLMIMLDGRLKQIFHTKLAKPVRALGGAVFGVFFLFLIWSLAAQVFIIWPSMKMQKPFTQEGSRTGYYAAQLAPTLYQIITFQKNSSEKNKE